MIRCLVLTGAVVLFRTGMEAAPHIFVIRDVIEASDGGMTREHFGNVKLVFGNAPELTRPAKLVEMKPH